MNAIVKNTGNIAFYWTPREEHEFEEDYWICKGSWAASILPSMTHQFFSEPTK